MSTAVTRRAFVNRALQAGALAGLGDFLFLRGLPPLHARDIATPPVAQFCPDIEPLVRLIEETPRDRLLEAAAERIKAGTSYQQLLAALMLAGVRGIKPRPVGFQFHAVLVVNSAHLATLASTDKDRWLPLFWGLDNFKRSQAINKERNAGWLMPAVEEAKVPPADKAKERFIEAMDRWDVDGADLAITALARSATPGEIYELFWRYGCRDFRDIGHKAIYAANSFRTLQTIGFCHAEPILRSLTFAVLEHGPGSPDRRDLEPERPFRDNLSRVKDIPANWQGGKPSAEAARDVLASHRTMSPDEACKQVVGLLQKGVHPSSVWDGLFLRAGELLMRQPGIVGVHCVTSTNALHYAFQASSNDETRRLLLLQAAAFLPLFQKFMAGRGKLAEVSLDGLEKADGKGDLPARIEEIFADVSKDRMLAARKTLALLEQSPEQCPMLMAAARRLIFTKGNDSHDYKFSSAALEDYYNVSPRWRPYYLASSMFNLRGTGNTDNELIKRTRDVLAKS
jgi:hypothetical protein